MARDLPENSDLETSGMEERNMVVLASRSGIARCGLRAILRRVCRIDTLIEAETVDAVLDPVEGMSFDLIVIDQDLIRLDADGGLASLHSIYPETKIIIVCEHICRTTAAAAIAMGVHGIISTSASEAVVSKAFEQVLGGEIFVPNDMADEPLPQSFELSQPDLMAYSDLSNRQREVLDLILTANSNKQIARVLSLSEGTVKSHVSVLMRKLGVTSRAGIAVAGLQMKYKEAGASALGSPFLPAA